MAYRPLRLGSQIGVPTVGAVLTGLLVALVAAPPAQASSQARQESVATQDTRVLLSMSAGESHTCAVRADGTVACWGANGTGQLGDNSTIPRPTPVTVRDITTAVAVSAGGGHTCALLVDGSVRCWGSNSNGQLGDGTTSLRKVPVRVRGLSGAVSIAAGAFHTCAVLVDGTVRCWGANDEGQLGDDTQIERHQPVPVLRELRGSTEALRGAVAIAAGDAHTCIARTGGTVSCWGLNAFGQLGDGTTTRRPRPVRVETGPSGAVLQGALTIAAGAVHTCAVTSAATAVCWGNNNDGQINGSTTNQLFPVAVIGLTNAVAVAAGVQHTCVLRSTGGVVCLGNNLTGQLGDGTFTSRAAIGPVRDAAGGNLANAIAVTSGALHGCTLHADGSRQCWGMNEAGQLGDGTTQTRNRATPVTDPAAPPGGFVTGRDVNAGGALSCAVRATGAASCWGGPYEFVPTTDPTLKNVLAVTTGDEHGCALAADGAVRCWGTNDDGQLGDGTTSSRFRPELVTGLATQAVAVAAGGAHTCARLVTGQVRCWGGNVFGQLGDGSTDALSTVPRIVDLGLQAVAIATGTAHSCAIGSDSFVYCWGFNFFGQLGVSDGPIVRRTPVQVRLAGAAGLAAGFAHTCALIPSGLFVGGEVWCWGLNDSGQLGDNTVTTRANASPVENLANAVAVSAGGGHACAVLADGTARCWGDNRSGQLGDGSRSNRLRPVRVTGLTNVVAISAGLLHTCALRADGAVFCWGENSGDDGTGLGQLGNGTTVDSLRPVEVGSFRANVAPTARLAARGHRVLLTAVVNCPVGHLVTIEMGLTQDGTVGQGRASGQCEGGLAAYPVQVLARQEDPFGPGDAVAEITAIVRHGGHVVDVHEWRRAVEVVAAP